MQMQIPDAIPPNSLVQDESQQKIPHNALQQARAGRHAGTQACMQGDPRAQPTAPAPHANMQQTERSVHAHQAQRATKAYEAERQRRPRR
jgi:hypothetical protein